MTLLDHYKTACQQYGYSIDSAQLAVIDHMQSLQKKLLQAQQRRQSLLGKVLRKSYIPGLYLWGGVGIGKTFLMDCFFESLALDHKKRIHFHDFMRELHLALTKRQGQKNPLTAIAKHYAQSTQVLCLDEVIVTDITDAMLLGKFLQLLFTHGVCLVATANTEPDMLYYRGLQRQQFLPAIDAIQQHMQIIHLQTTTDYRQLFLKKAGVFHIPHNQQAVDTMEQTFTMLGHGEQVSSTPVSLLGRPIKVIKRTQTIIWFDFQDLCQPPRSQRDYLELVTHYSTFFISDIPFIPAHANNTIQLFIRLIDILYDAKASLFCSLQKPITELYTDGSQVNAYRRTASRLQEMRSLDYATHAHHSADK